MHALPALLLHDLGITPAAALLVMGLFALACAAATVPLLCAVVGVVALVRGPDARLGSVALRDAWRPSLGMLLVVLTVCMAAGAAMRASMLDTIDAIDTIATAVLVPGFLVAYPIVGDMPGAAGRAIAIAGSTLFWMVATTGGSVLVPAARGWLARRAG